jgi:hypothetical protein
MIAHLQDGRYANTRILQAPTAQQMHQPHFTYDPTQPGMTYGFREAGSPRTWNGLRELSSGWGPVLWHDGGGPRAPTSYLQLLPARGLGLFMAFNSDAYSVLDQVLGAFYDHYDPVRPPSRLPAPSGADGNGSGQDLDRFTGIYRPTGYAHRTLAKLLLLQGDDLPQVIASGTTLAIRWLPAAPPQPLVQNGPRVFAGADDQFQFTFLAGPGDQITGMEWGNLFVLEKVPWYGTLGFQRALFAGFLLVFLGGAGAWPVARLRNRFRPRRAADRRPPVLVWLLLGGTGLLNAVFLLGLIWLLPRALDLGLQFGMLPGLGALFGLPLATSVLAVGLLVLTLPVWRSRAWSVLGRSAYSCFTLVALAFIPFLLYWNLLGFQW